MSKTTIVAMIAIALTVPYSIRCHAKADSTQDQKPIEPVYILELPADQMTKLEAARVLIKDETRTVYKCQPQTINERLSLVNKRVAKGGDK